MAQGAFEELDYGMTPLAVEFATALPPWVAPAYASELARPTATEPALAWPPLLATEVAVASAAREVAATDNSKDRARTWHRFMAVPPFWITIPLGPGQRSRASEGETHADRQ